MSEPVFSRIEQQDLVNHIADQLTEALLRGELAPGTHLSEARTARDMGVSRAPIREAARLLESRGLLISRPRRGFFVRSFTAEQLDDVYDLRLCIECHAVRQLANNMNANIESTLYQQIARMQQVAVEGSIESQIEEDLQFHRMLCRFSGNQRLLQVFDELSRELRFCILLIGRFYDSPEELADTHKPILAPLIGGDGPGCERALSYHIGVARHHVVEMFRQRKS